MFKPVSSQPDFLEIEHRILKFWEQSKAFEKLRQKNQGRRRFSFLDGPITANNPMGVHHAWGRTYKDIFQRYKAMLGHEMRYQNGFDCQGLWVEVEVERELGFKSKRDIEKYGIDRFVEKCKERARKFSQIQTQQSVRLGYWMDWANSYYTMSEENNYTIWHFLQRCHQKGWIYKGHDVMPWCPRCGTAISEHEIATEGYRELTHTGVFIKFPLTERPNEHLLVWTTTPWTLTSNVAAAVHPEFTYVKAKQAEQYYYLAKERLEVLQGEYEIIEEVSGQRLVGLVYRGPFDELEAQLAVKHRVIPWKQVSRHEGTGIVHIAPGCGKEDFTLGKEFDLAVIAPLDESGNYLQGFNWLSGRNVFEVTPAILEDLKKKRLVYKAERYTHRYPVCWRCDTELVFRLVDEWFISMDELRYQIMDVAKRITWMPAFGLERELDWLRNMHDWCISKKRYWGLALPIFECQCGHFQVIGSEEELKAKAVEGWEQFEGHSPHRPWIDAVKIRCEKCGKLVSRIPDVGNPWLDAGIVPFSTLDYRRNRQYWEKWFPADFITECFPGQFRNWFYSLLAMSTVLEGREPFRTVLGHAKVLDENGEEMHKSKGNAIWFDDAVERMGADVMRWIFASHNPANNLNFGYSLATDVRRKFLRLWNSYSFLVTYANLDKVNPSEKHIPVARRSLLDRWITAELQLLIQRTIEYMNSYDVASPVRLIDEFIERLSNWYIRRSRRRFWKSESDFDKISAYLTLYDVLVTLCKLMAPVLPFLCEELYQNLVRSIDSSAPESVHLCDFPASDPELIDGQLLEDMDWVIRAANLGRAARNQAAVKIRQPLSSLFVLAPDGKSKKAISRLESLLTEEINVKQIRFVQNTAELTTLKVKPNLKVLGPKWGKLTYRIAEAVNSLKPEQACLLSEGKDVQVKVDSQQVQLSPTDVEIIRVERENLVVESQGNLTVALDTTLTEELMDEGLAREFVHKVQNMRKEAGFEIADRIKIYYQSTERLEKALKSFEDYIKAETLCLEFQRGEEKGELRTSVRINDQSADIAVERVK
ncbi:MAG: isoleucine--tRNA ligase [Candidatus Latescibacteria bacterium]|nr:isoleucine--tRNA ligase [Candidatus Latescibacterota bacterium]